MSKEAMKLALETLEVWKGYMPALWDKTDEQAITALREALAEQPAQQEAKIVRWNCPCENKYTFHGFTKAPPQRTWVEMSDERIKGIFSYHGQFASGKDLPMLRVIEAMLKENASPQRTWVGLTDQEFQWIYDHGRTPAGMLELVEAKLKEKNT